MAVLDHEHFRLKMLYKEKKMITAQLEQHEQTAKKIDVSKYLRLSAMFSVQYDNWIYQTTGR